MSTKIITGKARFSFVKVFEAEANKEGDSKKYSISIIIPKKDKKTIKKIEDAIQAAAEAGKAKFGGTIPKKLKSVFRDGDEDRPDDEAYEDSMFFNASSTRKPEIVDADLNPIMSRDEFYSGCFGRASINFYAYNVDGSKGIAAGLNNLQKLEDGENLGGGSSTAAADFGDDDDLMG